jgi:hypothetical protein
MSMGGWRSLRFCWGVRLLWRLLRRKRNRRSRRGYKTRVMVRTITFRISRTRVRMFSALSLRCILCFLDFELFFVPCSSHYSVKSFLLDVFSASSRQISAFMTQTIIAPCHSPLKVSFPTQSDNPSQSSQSSSCGSSARHYPLILQAPLPNLLLERLLVLQHPKSHFANSERIH